ncbi:MAG TPA: response regulator transcription factor [Anaerolineae bacterium]|nr:response regulator transcription factor [Anaerolineae bacterium]HQI86220.1 response regulator transcription factor [Anaerolineae bacterium]
MTGKLRTLVVDDEERIRFLLHEILRRDGHEVVMATNGEEALDLLQETFFELLILDLNLGGVIDGQRVLEAVKWRWPETIVIILTAHGSLESALDAIREGVDGYLLKPARAAEIRQTVQRVLARQKGKGQRDEPVEPAQAEHTLHLAPFHVDRAKHLVTRNGQPLDLTPAEFRLLVYLLENAHRVIAPQELVQTVQGYQCQEDREAREIIRWHIHRLRSKVETDPTQPRYILNVRGVGYTLGLDEATR